MAYAIKLVTTLHKGDVIQRNIENRLARLSCVDADRDYVIWRTDNGDLIMEDAPVSQRVLRWS